MYQYNDLNFFCYTSHTKLMGEEGEGGIVESPSLSICRFKFKNSILSLFSANFLTLHLVGCILHLGVRMMHLT